MAENGKEARNSTNDESIGLVDGRTLPIKFKFETGIVILGRSMKSFSNGSFSWQSFKGIGAVPTGSILITTPYNWTVISAPNSFITGDNQERLRIRADPPSNHLVVNRVEICFDAD